MESILHSVWKLTFGRKLELTENELAATEKVQEILMREITD